MFRYLWIVWLQQDRASSAPAIAAGTPRLASPPPAAAPSRPPAPVEAAATPPTDDGSTFNSACTFSQSGRDGETQVAMLLQAKIIM